MQTITIVDPEEFATVKRELAEMKAVMRAYITSQEEWLTREQALQVSGIKTRETLEKYARASAPDTQEPGRIMWRKQGSKCRYARTSCIDYAQRKLGQPALA